LTFFVVVNEMTKVVVLAVLLLACVCFAEEAAAPKYSSFECESYDKDHPEDLSMRNCILRDVVLASENGQPVMLFYAREGQDTPLLAANKKDGKGRIVEIAPRIYASVKVVYEAIPEKLTPVKDTAVLMSAQGNNNVQFLFDTFFGVYWMLLKTGDIGKDKVVVDDPDAITIIEVGRANEFTRVLQGSVTTKTPMPLRKMKGVLFSRVVAGPAGHLMLTSARGTMKNSPVLREDVERYRKFFLTVAMVNDEDFDPIRVLIAQRFNSKRITNTDDVFTAVNSVANGQVAFLSQLSIKSQIDMVAGSGIYLATHSDDIAYMVFLRPGMHFVEIMPYGVQSDIAKNLAEMCGLKYSVWQNPDRSRAEFDAKILDKYPLTEEQKKKIIEADKYVKTLPSGARPYWESQNTKVDAEALKELLLGIIPPELQKSAETAAADAKAEKTEL